MIAKYIALSNIISVLSDNISHTCLQEPLLILKKIILLLILYQHIAAYSCAIKFACLVPGNVCVQDEGMMKLIETLVLIQYHVEIIL